MVRPLLRTQVPTSHPNSSAPTPNTAIKSSHPKARPSYSQEGANITERGRASKPAPPTIRGTDARSESERKWRSLQGGGLCPQTPACCRAHIHGQASWVPLTLRQACCQEFPDSAMCVQNFNDSRGIAIRMTYRISLRSSSLWEPRHPLLKVVKY